jgi:hypothetical protein
MRLCRAYAGSNEAEVAWLSFAVLDKAEDTS